MIERRKERSKRSKQRKKDNHIVYLVNLFLFCTQGYQVMSYALIGIEFFIDLEGVRPSYMTDIYIYIYIYIYMKVNNGKESDSMEKKGKTK